MRVSTGSTTVSWRTPVVMGLVLLVGIAAFGWPFLASPDSQLGQMGHSTDASFFFVALMALMAVALLAEMTSGGVDAKTIAVLGVLAAAFVVNRLRRLWARVRDLSAQASARVREWSGGS